MKPNSLKNQRLIKQYPFVATILKRRMLPDAPWKKECSYEDRMKDATRVNDLIISVEKADGDLMFRRADNVGLGEDNSCIFQIEGKRKDQVMRRGEYLFAINSKGEIINRVDWPKDDYERRANGEVYGWSALWGDYKVTQRGREYSNPIYGFVKYLVWVTVEAWHQDTGNDDAPGSRFGEFRDRSVRLTIYVEPDCGFKNLCEQSHLEDHLYLDSRLFMRATINDTRDILTIGDKLATLCRLFQDEVYFNGMKAVLDNGKHRGASGQFGSVKVLSAEMCGYDRVMLEDVMSWISFQLRPGAGETMYVLGMNGRLPQLRNLVETVVRFWDEKPESRAQFKPDAQVSVI